MFRPFLLQQGFDRYWVVHRSEAEAEEYESYTKVSSLLAQSRVPDWLTGIGGPALLELGGQILGWSNNAPRDSSSDTDLVAALRREFDDSSGSLVVLEEPALLMHPPFIEKDEETEVSEEPGENHWIDIRLVDKGNNPVSGVKYEIKLPDGTTRRGRTNAQGVIYYSGIDAGECKFSYIGLDQDWWEPA